MAYEREDKHIFKIVASVIGMLVLALLIVYLFVRLFDIIMLLYLSVIVALFFSIFVDFFDKKLKAPRVVGLLVALIVITGIIVALVALVLPTFLSQGEQLLSNLPKYFADLQRNTRTLALKYSVLDPIFGPGSPFEPTILLGKISESIGGVLSKGMGLFITGIGGFLTIVAVIIIAIYIVLKPNEHREGLLKLLPKSKRDRFKELIDTIVNTIRRWMLGQAASMLIIAVMTMIGYWIAGIKFAFFFGILTGLLCFVPYLGPVLSLIGPVLVSLIDSPIKVLWVFIIYIVTQTVESYFLTPLIMKRQVDLPPVLTILAVIGMGSLMGVIGIVLAVPTVAIAMVIIDETYLKRMETT
ncbi:hypothetical protein DRQ36_08460 [bacterium]|nr:MAG: hypothetical protein DRQ36_08460 [bacterium]